MAKASRASSLATWAQLCAEAFQYPGQLQGSSDFRSTGFVAGELDWGMAPPTSCASVSKPPHLLESQ